MGTKKGTPFGFFVGENEQKEKPVIEVIRQVRRSPDAGISCYYCDECHAIFTKVSTSGFEYCPACRKNWADKIPKAQYNLLKAWRKLWQRDDTKTL